MPTFESIPSWMHAGLAAALVAMPMVRPVTRPTTAGLTNPTQPADSPAVRLGLAEVKARLAAATQSAPPDLDRKSVV